MSCLEPLEFSPRIRFSRLVNHGENYTEVKRLHGDLIKVLPGGYYVTNGQYRLETMLGSCVTACIRDPLLKLGGINHFMLPQSTHHKSDWLSCERTRFGVHAMETLIGTLIKHGGDPKRFEVKLFGGGKVVTGMNTDVGRLNVEFARHYLKTEGLNLLSEDLGGAYSRRLIYDVSNGEVMLKRTLSSELVSRREYAHILQISQQVLVGEIELFKE